MRGRKMMLQVLLYMALTFSLILPVSTVGASATVPLPDDHSTIHLMADSPTAAPAMTLNTPGGNVTPMVAAGSGYIVGLKSDGTVVAVGDNYNGQCDVGSWRDIVQVAAGSRHTAGLRSDGTVVAVGNNYDGRCDVGGWTDIVQVAAGETHTLGLESDGTMVAAGLEVELAKWNLVLAVPPSLSPPSPSETPPINWPLIGGIIAAVIAAGLVTLLLRRKRAARTRGG